MLTPLISFSTAEELKAEIRSSILRFQFDEQRFDALASSGLPPLTSIAVFALILGVSPKLLSAIYKNPHRYYKEFPLEKKSGGIRLVRAPRVFLKAIQYYAARFIVAKMSVSAYAQGFCKGRGIVSNASIHANQPFLLNLDLANFFGSVREEHIRGAFRRLGYSTEMAGILSGLCTYNRILPQGAPTSPGLANAVFYELDLLIAELASTRNLRYSRYADDLSFSGISPIPRVFVSEVSNLLSRYGFLLNIDKTRFAGPNQARYVTGLVVNTKPQIDRIKRRKLRAMFHQADLRPANFLDRRAQIMGYASFVNSYDPVLGQKYLGIARRLSDIPQL